MSEFVKIVEKFGKMLRSFRDFADFRRSDGCRVDADALAVYEATCKAAGIAVDSALIARMTQNRDRRLKEVKKRPPCISNEAEGSIVRQRAFAKGVFHGRR